MTRHTPGPWHADHDGLFMRGDPIATIAELSPQKADIDEARANAHLIAAAPDLLAVAREFTKAAHDARDALNAAGIACPASIALAAERARHAIKKAEGRP